MHRKCMESVWRVSGRCAEGAWRVDFMLTRLLNAYDFIGCGGDP